MLALLFALGSGIISDDIMSPKSWIIFGIHAVVLTTALLIVLLPTSYVNKQTEYQLRRLIAIREIYIRIVRDARVL